MVNDDRAHQERDLTAELRLRPERPSVTRLSRKVLIGLTVIAVVIVVGAVYWALDIRVGGRHNGSELYNIAHKTETDQLAQLPRDYTGLPHKTTPPPKPGVPRLGPPLPGDFGRAANQQQQRAAQEAEAARTSRLFEHSNTVIQSSPSSAVRTTPTRRTKLSTQKPPIDPNAIQNMQDRKLAFLNGPVDRRTVSPDRLESPVSKYVLQAGSVIPAALLTGIRSDLPGQVTGQVTENIYDSPTGRYLLVPQGSKLIGLYDSQVSFGQSRVLLVWTRLILPNGRSIVLERQAGADPAGYAGLEDRVDYHWGRLFMAAALSTILGVGAELGARNKDSNSIRALRRGSSDTLNQAGQQVVRRNLNIQPTLTIRPGFPVRVIVDRDLILALYRPCGVTTCPS
jgi:type IV secretory pathway VirB10-like protein